MSEERKAYTLDFEAPAPKTERRGIQKPEYNNTVNMFLRNEKSYAEVKIPKGEKSSSIQIGLKNAIKRMEKSNEIKPIRRKGKLYLITKDYSDKQGWVWKVIRKRK